MLRSCSGALDAKEYWQASLGVGNALRCGSASRLCTGVRLLGVGRPFSFAIAASSGCRPKW